MRLSNASRWALLVTANVAVVCVLGLYQPGLAAPREGNEPFANSIEQRAEMIAQLREINALLREQNALLRSGEARVMVVTKQEP